MIGQQRHWTRAGWTRRAAGVATALALSGMAVEPSEAAGQSAAGDAAPARASALIDSVGPARLRVVADEADAAVAVILANDSSALARASRQLRESEGLWALHAREASMHRELADSSIISFLRSDSMAARAHTVRATLAGWRDANITGAVGRAAAYLPPGTPMRATLYFEIKPRLNSFVFSTDSGPSLFVAIDSTISAAGFENVLAHELHHIGSAAACATRDATQPEPLKTAVTWMTAFGEGWAVLAAAGGPDVYPQATQDSASRATWDNAYAHVARDMGRLDQFFRDVLQRRLTAPDSITSTAMSFFGPVQGPWYTVGYLMVRTIEKTDGRTRLLATLCDPAQLLLTYQRIAQRHTAGSPPLPLWSDTVIARLAAAATGKEGH
jgi:hypothetical protein